MPSGEWLLDSQLTEDVGLGQRGRGHRGLGRAGHGVLDQLAPRIGEVGIDLLLAGLERLGAARLAATGLKIGETAVDLMETAHLDVVGQISCDSSNERGGKVLIECQPNRLPLIHAAAGRSADNCRSRSSASATTAAGSS